MPSKKNKFYNMVSGNEIFIFDEIGFWGTDAQTFVNDLTAIKDETVVVRIMSPGGSVIDALAIYDILKNSSKTVEVVVNFAASAASIIAMAGDSVTISENGYFLIHRPTVDTWGGNSDDLRKNANILDEITDRLVSIYEEKTGFGRAEIERMVDEETMINAEEAVEMGFADSITEAAKEAAKIPLSILSKLENKKKVNKMAKKIKNEEVSEEVVDETTEEVEATEEVAETTEEETEEVVDETTEEVIDEVSQEDQIKNMIADAVAAAVAPLNTTIESLKEQLTAAPAQNRSGFRTPQNTLGKIGFMAQVKRIQKDEDMSYNDALASAIAKFPKAHAEFLKEQTKKATK